ncbi:putative mitochondrial chaperone BCS1-B [Cytospora mali]|uniref:Mitochondrial chaperone BCS1-B n=1 Tax=Cytospora mali TaxID=578113 RepID=A0A194W0C9_CYTMA|nr:putative mitochondrial chaperone BCS1-B [Valsa mali]
MASHNVCQPMTEANGMDSAPPQFALLDMFFPGFSTFSRAIEKYFKIDLNLYIPLILLLGAITFAWQYFTEAFWDQLESYFMSVVDIRQDDEIYNMLMAWVAQQRFSQGARRFVVNTNLNSRSWYLRRWEDDEEEEGDDCETDSLQQETKKKALAYTPTFGSHYFWHKGRIYIFRRDKNRDQQGTASEREEISISCFGRDPGVLKELLLEARAQFIQRDEHKTLIYRGTVAAGGYCPSWQRCLARASRPFSTVILNDKVKQDLIDDVRDYLDPATRRWYSNRGIPYRRGYLLYGPPGTGKSSLSLALAGFFKMRIYIVSLSSPFSSEETLGELFAELPRRCVVLLEDIDTAGLTHTREENKGQNDNGDGKTSDMTPGKLTTGNDNNNNYNNNNNNNNNNSNGRLSLSGLLNILDGVASQEGRVLIMTTNHIDKLDKALIRPGRVDMMVQFGLADAGMIVSIFKAIFAPLEGDDPELITPKGASPRDVEEVMKRVAADSARRDEITVKVEKLAEEFAKKVPAHEFSPAELQGLLLKNKRDPEGAVNAAEEWVIEKRKEKAVKQLEEAEEKRKKEEAQKKAKEEEEKKKKEEEEKKAKEEEEKKKAEEKKKKKTEKEEKRNKRKNKSRSKNSGRKSKKESSSDTGSDSNTSDSSSDAGSGSESESDKKNSKKETKIGVKIKVDKVSGTDEDGLKVPVSATTDRSDGFIDVEKERDDDNRSRTHGTDSGHGTAA